MLTISDIEIISSSNRVRQLFDDLAASFTRGGGRPWLACSDCVCIAMLALLYSAPRIASTNALKRNLSLAGHESTRILTNLQRPNTLLFDRRHDCPACASTRLARSRRRNLREKAMGIVFLPYRCVDCDLRIFQFRSPTLARWWASARSGCNWVYLLWRLRRRAAHKSS